MNTGVHVIEVFFCSERIVGHGKHLAHMSGLLALERILLAAHTDVASLLAPVDGGRVPFEGFLASGVAHSSVVVRTVGK